jgi:LmbE family N-acetylglucosaminyl deacetylase
MEQKQQQKPPERILVIAAHHDDIEFGVAGSVAHWVTDGAHVTYCIVTDGASGSNDPTANLAALIETRQHEQQAAARIVGVEDVRFLSYRDGVLEPSIALRRDLTRLIRETRPERVVCQDPTTVFVGDGYINHPDHRAAGEAAIYATFPSAESRPIFPELLLEGYEPHHVDELYLMLTTQPDYFIDITETMNRKLEALLCHASQLGDEVADWISERNAEMGKQAGYTYAEAFRVMNLRRNRDEE